MAAMIHPSANLDLFVAWRPSTLAQAGFHSGLDLETRTVRVMGSGAWHEDDADLYFDQQSRIIEEARRRFGPLKVFFDVRDWVVENEQSSLQFQDMNAEIYKPEDRLVAVVGSSVSKRHPRVALSVGNREVFISMNAAEMWLQAYASH